MRNRNRNYQDREGYEDRYSGTDRTNRRQASDYDRFDSPTYASGRGFSDYTPNGRYFGGAGPQFGEGYTGNPYENDGGPFSSDYDLEYQPHDRYPGGRYRSHRPYGGADRNFEYPDSERGFAPGPSNYDRDRGWWDKTADEVSSWFGDDDAARRRDMDTRHEGRHRGRGPRNYTRSDDRIKEDINDRLTDHSYLDASDIDVDVSDGDVILKGNVSSRYEKRCRRGYRRKRFECR